MRQGFDGATYRAHVRRLLSADRYAEQVVATEVRVTDEDVAAFYHANPGVFAQPERLRLRCIAIATGPSGDAAQRKAARERIDALRAQLVAGADFAQLARANSDDPTRQWGGELDPVAPDELPEWMRRAIDGLAPGALSPVMETESALYVVRIEERLPATNVTLDAARADIRDRLTATRARDALERRGRELRAAAKVELLMAL
jgi:parvulin-like peptidyl-prolyl isomerase